MPRYVMKEAPDVDFYVEWSTIVDTFVFAGTRAETLAHLSETSDPWLRGDAPHHPEVRMQRVDETGTSAMWVTMENQTNPAFAAHGFVDPGAWEDTASIYNERGTITRANIFVLVRRLAEDPLADVTDLLEPFEDAEEVEPA